MPDIPDMFAMNDMCPHERERHVEAAELVAATAVRLAEFLRSGEDRHASVAMIFLTMVGAQLTGELTERFTKAIGSVDIDRVIDLIMKGNHEPDA